MFQKIAPLIILLIFVLGTAFVIYGLEQASEMSHPQKKSLQQGE
ncbi:hypothetical protein [Nitratifractor sp.]